MGGLIIYIFFYTLGVSIWQHVMYKVYESKYILSLKDASRPSLHFTLTVWTLVFPVWAEDRKEEIVNAWLYSDARAVCQTSLIHLFITLYEFIWCRNWYICLVLETTVHTLTVTMQGVLFVEPLRWRKCSWSWFYFFVTRCHCIHKCATGTEGNGQQRKVK